MKKQTKWIARVIAITAGICVFSANPVMAMEEVIISDEPIIEQTIEPAEVRYDDINICQELYDRLTETQRDDLRRTVAAEAQSLGLEGQIAVMEVIFNRCLSDRWPNDIYGVISQKGQFEGYRCRYKSWVAPDETTDLAIQMAIEERYPYIIEAMIVEHGYNTDPYDYDCFATKKQSQCIAGCYLFQGTKYNHHYFGIMK